MKATVRVMGFCKPLEEVMCLGLCKTLKEAAGVVAAIEVANGGVEKLSKTWTVWVEREG